MACCKEVGIMAKKEKDFDTINDGSHAIRKFTIGDFLIIFILGSK